MSEQEKKLGPDFARGFPFEDLSEGRMILGQVGGEAVVLARTGAALFAIGAECTHYHGPLAEGMLVADTVRCPWHHACFSLRTGEALRAPALDPVACWRVEQQDGKIYVREKLEPAERRARPKAGAGPESIVIIGGGAAGNAAAEMLRREGYSGPVTMLSADDAGPYDRPNLSKDYLAGNAPEEWIPLRSPDFYREHGVELKLGVRAVAIDPKGREVRVSDGSRQRFGALLLATGAEPVHLGIPGSDLPHIHYLRTLTDSRTVDPYLETSIPGIWAAGDIARRPDRLTGETIRIEHWVVAERRGQTAARNMLGARERFDAVPFFWSQQHDLQLNYVGHAAKWDRVEIDGSLAAKDCTVTYRQSGRKLAVLTIGRDRASLAAEIELEKTIAAGS
jgi:nitrite reductase/ring-hydroxylating ferredoxin subunit